MLDIYVFGVSAHKELQVVEELCREKISKSFIADLTQQLNLMIRELQYRILSETMIPLKSRKLISKVF